MPIGIIFKNPPPICYLYPTANARARGACNLCSGAAAGRYAHMCAYTVRRGMFCTAPVAKRARVCDARGQRRARDALKMSCFAFSSLSLSLCSLFPFPCSSFLCDSLRTERWIADLESLLSLKSQYYFSLVELLCRLLTSLCVRLLDCLRYYLSLKKQFTAIFL